VDWHTVWHTIAGARLEYIAGALAITTSSFFWRSVRWRILLNAEADFSVPTVFWANMAGYLGNNFLPARAGELIRTLLISSRSSLSKTYVLTTALGERLMDVIALVLWSSLALMAIDPKPAWMAQLSGTMAVVAGAGAVAIVVLPHAGGLAERLLKRAPLPARLRGFLLRLTDQVLLGLRAFHHWGRLAGFILLTIVIWVSDSLGVIVGAKALGLSISFPVAVLLLTGLGLGSALPSTPGYVGIYQFVAVTVLTPFGITRDNAMAYILVAQALGYVVVLSFGLPGLYKLQMQAPAGRKLWTAGAG
jgi:glycosyltransferase 2 family protein